jgi:hypothetical protein
MEIGTSSCTEQPGCVQLSQSEKEIVLSLEDVATLFALGDGIAAPELSREVKRRVAETRKVLLGRSAQERLPSPHNSAVHGSFGR